MKAFIIDAPGKTSLADVTEPTLGEGDVLLRVRTVGYCGTDLSTFRGVNPLVSYPRIPGHELGCTIEVIGSAVPNPHSSSSISISAARKLFGAYRTGAAISCRQVWSTTSLQSSSRLLQMNTR